MVEAQPKSKWQQFTSWLNKQFWRCISKLGEWGIFEDIRSAIVGTIVGSTIGVVVGLTTVALSSPPRKETLINTNADGIAQPMHTLLDQLKGEKDPPSFIFEPPNLEKFYVCEFSHLVGASMRELVLFYINKYSMCLSLNQTSPKSYTVRPNLHSGFLVSRNGNWFCKCK